MKGKSFFMFAIFIATFSLLCWLSINVISLLPMSDVVKAMLFFLSGCAGLFVTLYITFAADEWYDSIVKCIRKTKKKSYSDKMKNCANCIHSEQGEFPSTENCRYCRAVYNYCKLSKEHTKWTDVCEKWETKQ